MKSETKRFRDLSNICFNNRLFFFLFSNLKQKLLPCISSMSIKGFKSSPKETQLSLRNVWPCSNCLGGVLNTYLEVLRVTNFKEFSYEMKEIMKRDLLFISSHIKLVVQQAKHATMPHQRLFMSVLKAHHRRVRVNCLIKKPQ